GADGAQGVPDPVADPDSGEGLPIGAGLHGGTSAGSALEEHDAVSPGARVQPTDVSAEAVEIHPLPLALGATEGSGLTAGRHTRDPADHHEVTTRQGARVAEPGVAVGPDLERPLLTLPRGAVARGPHSTVGVVGADEA